MSQAVIGVATAEDDHRENEPWRIYPCTEPAVRLDSQAIAAGRNASDNQGNVHLRASFRVLAEQWRKETGMLSSISKMMRHPAYQKIIAMGEPAVSLILGELRDRPAHWFVALKAITKQSPVPVHERSDPKKARDAWLKWGKQRGLIE